MDRMSIGKENFYRNHILKEKTKLKNMTQLYQILAQNRIRKTGIEIETEIGIKRVSIKEKIVLKENKKVGKDKDLKKREKDQGQTRTKRRTKSVKTPLTVIGAIRKRKRDTHLILSDMIWFERNRFSNIFELLQYYNNLSYFKQVDG